MMPKGQPATPYAGVNNTNILNGLSLVYRRALKLSEDGHNILSINIGGHRPVITISPPPEGSLPSGIKITQVTPHGRSTGHVTNIGDCQIEWLTLDEIRRHG